MFRKLQRVVVKQYLNETKNAEIHSAAEIESTYFWKLVNFRRKKI